jgi:hypothetical protein
MLRYSLATVTLTTILAIGCGGKGGGDTGPHIATTVIFSSVNPMVYSVKPEWSPDGTKIAFEGSYTNPSNPSDPDNGGWDVFTVNATPGATPVRISKYSSTSWELAGRTPTYTSSGILVYWVGSITGQTGLHLMAAATGQVENSPAPSIHHSYASADVPSTWSPNGMTISGDGSKVVQIWSLGSCLLDWSGGGAAPVSTTFTGASQGVISREGTHIAYGKSDGTIAYKAISGGAETVLGTGSNPSWATGGRLGFAVSNGYKVHNINNGSAVIYAGSGPYQEPTLSWDASKIAFRNFGAANTGISVGTLLAQ